MPKISVVMSTYNEPMEWLKGSIESILNQSFSDFEFLIVNDNPERKALADIISHYASKDNRVIIINNPQNLGLAKSCNRAFELASSSLIARMDADDIAMPDRLKLQYEFLEKHQNIFLIGSSVRIIDRNGVTKGKVIKASKHEKIARNILAGRLSFYHPTIMFRNEGFLYREKFSTTMDCDFYLICLSQKKRFSNLKQILLHYRMSGQSISMKKKHEQVIYKKLALKFYKEREIGDKDSYDKIDFNNMQQCLKFLNISQRQLDRMIFKEKTVFALGGNDLLAARKAFRNYSKGRPFFIEKFILWFFVYMPFAYKIYRKIRYEL